MRAKLSTILACEALVIALFGALAWRVPGLRSDCALIACNVSVLMVAHAVVVPFRGTDFVIHDASPDSPLKVYFFAAIFVASFSGGHLRDALLGVA